MTTQGILSHVDHTLLAPTATWEEIKKLCEEAIHYHTASICIPPCYIGRVKQTYGDAVTICTVIGFPLGYCAASAKVKEAQQAVDDGAAEIDMVINISDMKNHDYQKVQDEIIAIRKATENRILKVIIETCYLSTEEKIAACKAVTVAKADYIKTSTGFGTAGAALEDIRLFRSHIGPDVKIKAAGGIRSVADMEAFLAAGADRLGTSSAIKLLEGAAATGY